MQFVDCMAHVVDTMRHVDT